MTDTRLTLDALRSKLELKLAMAREDGARVDATRAYEGFLADLDRLRMPHGGEEAGEVALTTEEVARRLGLRDPETVARYCREGHFAPRAGDDFTAAFQLDGPRSPWRVPTAVLGAYLRRRDRTADELPDAGDPLDEFDAFLRESA
jgi:hypothetical protein